MIFFLKKNFKEMRIFKDSSGSHEGNSSVELLGDDEDVTSKLYVYDGVTLYVEHSGMYILILIYFNFFFYF